MSDPNDDYGYNLPAEVFDDVVDGLIDFFTDWSSDDGDSDTDHCHCDDD